MPLLTQAIAITVLVFVAEVVDIPWWEVLGKLAVAYAAIWTVAKVRQMMIEKGVVSEAKRSRKA